MLKVHWKNGPPAGQWHVHSSVEMIRLGHPNTFGLGLEKQNLCILQEASVLIKVRDEGRVPSGSTNWHLALLGQERKYGSRAPNPAGFTNGLRL